MRLLALTACRRDEIGGLRWSEIVTWRDCGLTDTQCDELKKKGIALDAKVIALPGERTKNGQPHIVPLSADALATLDSIAQTRGRDLVFGRGEGGYSGWSRSKERLDVVCGVKDWTLHDLRRTGATRMADSGVAPHIVEAVLNHISGHKAGVAGVYNRAAYGAEKIAALDTLASYIKTAVAKAAGGNVSRLRAKGA